MNQKFFRLVQELLVLGYRAELSRESSFFHAKFFNVAGFPVGEIESSRMRPIGFEQAPQDYYEDPAFSRAAAELEQTKSLLADVDGGSK